MKKIYFKWWFWGIIVFVILFMFFMIKALSRLDDVNSGDLLNFYGSLLSFIGTVILGLIASFQTLKANRLSERLLKIEEEQYLPIVDIQEVMEIPTQLTKNAYNNAIHVILNSSLFFFSEDNKIEFSEKPILVFNLKNICSNYITSIKVSDVKQKTIYNQKRIIPSPVNCVSFNGGVAILNCEETRLFMISGIHHENFGILTQKERDNLQNTFTTTELIITFEISNIKGHKFKEIIRLSFFSYDSIESKLYYPSIVEKEILSITPIE